MKNRLVVWGTNEQNEKVLIALELQSESNKVMLYTFPESIAPEEFVNKMMAEWRNGKAAEFPEGHAVLERELSVVESLLPDELKVERPDIIIRAQTEWQFAVLSSKLHQAYEQELAEFKEKVQALGAYDQSLWDSLRAFWDKVQGQSRERNLFREHADNLRDNINALFDDLKKMRSRVQDEFISASQSVYDEFSKSLDDIEKRIAAGGSRLNSVFDDLKQMQRRYRDARMSNEHRNALWERLDGAFKAAKERKFGPGANEGSLVERHGRRLEGLREAIKRMEDSIKRDEEELAFQRKKIDASEGQLEAQIRMAKIKMIDERVGSKREKLAEMNHTRAEVERQINQAKDKESRRAEKDAERQRIEAAKEAAKKEIAASIKAQKETPAEEPAAEEPAQKESFLGAIGDAIGEALDDALLTAKAVANVVSENREEIIEEVKEKAQAAYDRATEVAVEAAEDVLEALKPKNKPAEEPAPETPAETPVAEETTAEASAETTAEATAEQPAAESTEEAPAAEVKKKTTRKKTV